MSEPGDPTQPPMPPTPDQASRDVVDFENFELKYLKLPQNDEDPVGTLKIKYNAIVFNIEGNRFRQGQEDIEVFSLFQNNISEGGLLLSLHFTLVGNAVVCKPNIRKVGQNNDNLRGMGRALARKLPEYIQFLSTTDMRPYDFIVERGYPTGAAKKISEEE